MEIKHINIEIEGALENADFNFYSQYAANNYDIRGLLINRTLENLIIQAEGDEENLSNFVNFIKNGPLKKNIYNLKTEFTETIGLNGFKALKTCKKEPIRLYTKIQNVFSRAR